MYQRVDSSVAKLQLCSVGRCVREFVVRTLKHNAHYLNVDEGRNGDLVLPWEKMRVVKVGRSWSEGGREKVGLYPCTRGGKFSFLSLNTEEYLFVGAKIGHLPWMLVPN